MTDMRASLTVTADASSVVVEGRRAAEAWRAFRQEASAPIRPQGAGTPSMPVRPAVQDVDRPAVNSNRIVIQDQKALEEAFRQTAASGGLVEAALDEIAKSAADSAQVFIAALDRDEAAMQDLASSLDPALRAMQEFEAAQLRIAIAVAAGVTQEVEAVRMLDQLTQRYDAFVASQRRNPDVGAARSSAAVFEADFAEREQADAARRAFDALEASLNPLIRAERELAQAQNVVNTALARGQISASQASRALLELDRRYDELGRSQSLSGQREQALEAEERAVRQLMLALDPAARAQREFAAAQDQITRALRLGIVTQEEATRSLRLLEAQQQAVGRGSLAMAGGVGGGLQNVSFQITDFIVQAQAGQAISVALAQQLPQLLGGFGAIGAVLGLVVAAGVPLISMFMGTKDAAGSLHDRLQKLESSIGNVSKYLKILRDENASQIFGSMAGEVRTLAAELLKLERAAELKNLRSALDKLLTDNIQAGSYAELWEALTASRGAPARTREEVTRDNYAKFTGGRGPSFDEFESRRANIDALAKAGKGNQVAAEVNSLIASFTAGGPVTDLNSALSETLLSLGQVSLIVAEVEAQFNGTAIAAQVWAGVVENAEGIWQRIKDQDAAIKADGEERLRIAENELSLATVIAQHGAESAEAEAERDRIARENYELELERVGIYGNQKEELLAIFDQHNAVTDATAAWANTMAGVRGEIEGILSAIASLGGGMVERAAKQAQIRALQAGSTIAEAAAAGTATRREAEYNARASSLGGGLIGRAVAGAERWFNEGSDAQAAQLAELEAAARKRDRSTGGGKSGGGANAGLGAMADIKAEIARLKPSYEADEEAAEAWRAKALTGLKKTQKGYAEFAADVEAIYQEKLAKAYEADLKRRDDWAAGVERAQLKLKDDMISWADFSEDVMLKWAKAGEDSFVKFVTTGKAQLGDFVDFVAEAFARLAYQQLIQPGLSNLMDIVTSSLGGALGGAGAGPAAALPTNHTGSPGVQRSYRLGSGYGDTMRPDEKLTMMREGEQIMTSRALENAGALISSLSAMASQSARPMQSEARPSVTIITQTRTPLEVEERETVDSQGNRQQQYVLSEAVSAGLSAPGGAARKRLASDFGLRRRGINR